MSRAHISDAASHVRSGAPLTPTCENLARFIAGRMQRALGRAASVTEVHVAEDETISATHRLDGDAAARG